MRRARQVSVAVLCLLPAWIVAAPAHAITSVYALQEAVATGGGSLVQYAVGPGGALTRSLPDTALGVAPQDITVTPDGRFAYVMTSVASGPGATIVSFARGADGRLVQNGAPTGPMRAVSRGIIVNPQGNRVYYGHPASALFFRAINPDGTLGAENAFPIGSGPPPTPYGQFLAMTPDGRSLYAAQFAGGGIPAVVWQSTIDPETGFGTPKTPASVEFPGTFIGGPTLSSIGRMAITPSASHLYLAPDSSGFGIGHWAIDPASGALTAGAALSPSNDGYVEAVVTLSASANALWAPSGSASTPPPRIRQFAVDAAGGFAALAPPQASYGVAGGARDAVATPDGASLYLGQAGVVSEWDVAPAGTVTPRNVAGATPVGGLTNAGIALAPSQAPVASFVAAPAVAGSASIFNGAASADPDGAIVRYDWDFGDGSSTPNGGPVTSHVYATPGPRTVTLTVTDADGTSTAQLWSGTRMLRNGGPTARTTRIVTIAAAPPAAAAARPRKGRSVTVRAASGRILVRVPGSRRYVPIGQLTEIPLGSIVDARNGKAQITTEVDARTRRTQTSIFYDWYFRILQTKGVRPITEARMTKGSFASCTPSRLARSGYATKSKQRSKKKVRRLWGKGEGDFRTGGKRSSATVRGTQWLVEDRCDGTLTRVKQGRVDVRDFRLRKTVKLWKRSGKRSLYLAKAP